MVMPPFNPAASPDARAVPHGRLARLARFGGLASGIAGGMIANGARQWASGEKPTLAGLLLTTGNARKFTQHLATMRGAAMKMGQLLSMDSGALLPPALAEIMGQLRADAAPMPPAQLQTVLARSWGKDWRQQFARFDVRPLAAASIGQVHRARHRDGRDLAIKVQYPGVRASIDSDVDNVAALVRLSGLVPAALAVAPMLADAKRQLHAEADYAQEGAYLVQFQQLLADAPAYIVPAFHADLSTCDVLAMDFVGGVGVETLVDAPQGVRDRVMTLMIALCLRELFVFGLMQTDPNFANYRYDVMSDRLILLDFGATRAFPDDIVAQYRGLLHAGMTADIAAAQAAMLGIGLIDTATPAQHQAAIARMFEMAFMPLRAGGVFDFGENTLVMAVRDEGLAIAADRDFWHIPPIDALFLQRKFGGLFLLGSRLRARVDMGALLAPYLGGMALR
jgi:predicted unusual protein kinase regulating ubiquinone biosynthesis (AarF/ABC1/UbiB family)